MGRSVACDPVLEGYLNKLSKINKTAIGLILGQPSLTGKDYVVHMGKTPDSEQNPEDSPKVINSVGDIANSAVAEHALNCLRMIGSSFNILGLFVVTETSIFNDNSAQQKLKTIFLDIKSTLDSNGLLYANTDEYDGGDKLVLNYVSQSSSYSCKTISSDPSKSVSLKAVDFKFLDKPVEWRQFESCYEVNQAFPLIEIQNHFNTEKCVMSTIEKIDEKLGKSLLFFNGEPGEKNCTLEKFVKERKLETAKIIKATIYSYISDSINENEESTKISQYDGLIHFSGIINSRVFGTPKNTLGDIEKFIKQDIIRSLTTRLQIYYDALLANDDGGTMCEHEANLNNTMPPRRVFYPIQKNSNVFFNDYLFSNEFEDTTVKQVKDVLDFDIEQSVIITKAEVYLEPALNTSGNNDSTMSDSNKTNDSLTAKETNRILLVGGIAAAILILIISVILHFVFK